MLKLQKPTETRWLSLENSVHALRRSYEAVKAVFEQEGSIGDATALGSAKLMSTPEFKCLLYFLSDVLSILGALSVTFQTKDLNPVTMERVVKSYKSSLTSLRNDPFSGDYMIDLESSDPEVGRSAFCTKCEQYVNRLLDNIDSRFQNVHTVTC